MKVISEPRPDRRYALCPVCGRQVELVNAGMRDHYTLSLDDREAMKSHLAAHEQYELVELIWKSMPTEDEQ